MPFAMPKAALHFLNFCNAKVGKKAAVVFLKKVLVTLCIALLSRKGSHAEFSVLCSNEGHQMGQMGQPPDEEPFL